jgi:repressor LexA
MQFQPVRKLTVSDALTRTQQSIYRYLSEHGARFAYPPSLDELARALKLSSRGSLHKHVQALIAAGLVEPMDRKRRGVRLTGSAPAQSARIELLGRIAAGRPIDAIEVPDSVDVPRALLGRQSCYALQVSGDSMRDEGILDGDIVVVESRGQARNGEIVVALIDGETATLKRIEQRPGKITLHPANSDLQPVSYKPERILIRGVLRALLRRYG